MTASRPKAALSRREHWEGVYEQKEPDSVSWYEETPAVSLELIGELGVTPDASVIDVGGGASRLVDEIVARGHLDVTVLDVSERALDYGRRRLAERVGVTWLCQDLLSFEPERKYDLWHDRAVFHFLVAAADRERYLEVVRSALLPGGLVIVATFAADGPESCSGLPVARYDPDGLAAVLGEGFETVLTRRHEHKTPSGAVQPFTWVAARRA